MVLFERHARMVHGYVAKSIKPLASLLLLALVLVLFLSILRASLFTEVDEHKRVWFEVSFLLLSAVLANMLVAHLRQPFVMTLLVVGMLISPSFISLAWPAFLKLAGLFPPQLAQRIPLAPPHVVSTGEVVSAFAQLGALLLLFKIGMHSEVRRIFSIRNFVVALLGVVLPFTAGYWLGMSWGYAPAVALFLGAALTATSVGISVAMLEEYRALDTEFARTLLGAAVIDDVLGLLALSLVINLSTSTTFTLAPLLDVGVLAGIFVAGGIIFGNFVVKSYFDRIYAPTLSPAVFLSALAFMLFYAYVAEMIGLSGIVGAFLAGLALNYSRIKEKLLEGLAPLEGLFTPIFFISLGILVDVKALGSYALPIALLTAVAILTKLLGCGVAALAAGLSRLEASLVGIGMAPRGEVAFIIGLYGLTLKVLSPAEYSIITAMAFLTTAITPPVLALLLRKR
ncbi:MAG: cation:proton antiporter [Candidatus Micrarchaeia archaeon]